MCNLKNKIFNNKGYAMIFTMVAVAVALISITILGIYFRQSLYDASLQQINTKAYYLAKASGEMTVAALSKNNDALLHAVGTYPRNQTIVHHDAAGEVLGTSKVAIQRETIDGEEWVVVRIETIIPDYRSNMTGTDNPDKTYTYKYRIHVRAQDSSARLYYVD